MRLLWQRHPTTVYWTPPIFSITTKYIVEIGIIGVIRIMNIPLKDSYDISIDILNGIEDNTLCNSPVGKVLKDNINSVYLHCKESATQPDTPINPTPVFSLVYDIDDKTKPYERLHYIELCQNEYETTKHTKLSNQCVALTCFPAPSKCLVMFIAL